MNDINVHTANGDDSLETARGSRQNGSQRMEGFFRCALVTSAIIVAAFLGASLALGYPWPPPDQHLYVLYLLLALNCFFQRYHMAHGPAAAFRPAELLKRKTLVWVFTFLFATLIVALTELKAVPRQFLFAVVCVAFVGDVALVWVEHVRRSVEAESGAKQERDAGRDTSAISYPRAGAGLLSLGIGFALATTVKSGGSILYAHAELIIAIVLVSWVMAASVTRAYSATPRNNIYYRISPALKLGVIMALLASMLYFYGGLEHVSRGLLFGTIAVFTVLQVVTDLSWGAVDARKRSLLPETGQASPLPAVPEPAHPEPQQAGAAKGFQLQEHLPEQVVVDGRQELSELLNENLPHTEGRDVSILFSTDKEDVNALEADRRVLINLRGLNYIENINEYLASCYDKIPQGGHLVLWFYPLDTIAQRLRAKMPRSLYVVLYPLHFVWFRVVPKLPVLDKLYSYVTKGKRSNISKAEVFGRLAYNGFSVVDAGDIRGRMYVVARADRAPRTGVAPSFGPIARLPRVGLNGEEVTIYKIRTMHPYSEFIQKDIFDRQGLDESGKLMEDFRVTAWGKILRKYWIDELPQLYNWLRGDVGLVGVRALSHHYFSLYPRSVQELRIQHRPGLVPPFYADMARSFPEIIESERRYLQARSARPALVDTKYFLSAMYNILFKGARSS